MPEEIFVLECLGILKKNIANCFDNLDTRLHKAMGFRRWLVYLQDTTHHTRVTTRGRESIIYIYTYELKNIICSVRSELFKIHFTPPHNFIQVICDALQGIQYAIHRWSQILVGGPASNSKLTIF